MSFPLHDQEQVEVTLVRLSDGRLVARTADELTAAPAPALEE